MNREEIRARWKKATPGPWEWHGWGDEGPDLVVIRHVPDRRNKTGERLEYDAVLSAGGMHTPGYVSVDDADADAIAHAPTDIRALLDELEAQDRLIEQLGTALDWYADSTNYIAHIWAQTWPDVNRDQGGRARAALAALSTWKDGQMSDRPNARARG